jgi:hypothetical protein
MTTPTPGPQSPSFMLPGAFPTLDRTAEGLLWVTTTRATPEELRLHLAFRLLKLWHEMQEVQEFARFMAVARDETPDIPPWLHTSTSVALPPWVTAMPEDAYKALDCEWRGDNIDDLDEEA